MEAQGNNVHGKLFLISVPIGNFADMTLRAINSLQSSDMIICENRKETIKLLKHFEINKEIDVINEHNESEIVTEYISLLKNGKIISLVSDCGTPVFEDPGNILVGECISNDINIEFVHGANSLLASIITSGFNISRFYYAGFLSLKNDIRRQQIFKLSKISVPVVLMETPYRLISILKDIMRIIKDSELILCFNMTMGSEKIFRGNPEEIIQMAETELAPYNHKGEFILIIKNNIT